MAVPNQKYRPWNLQSKIHLNFCCASKKNCVYLKNPSPPRGSSTSAAARRLRVHRWMPKRWHQWISLRQWIPVRRGVWTNGWLDVRQRRGVVETRFGHVLLLLLENSIWKHLKRNDAKLWLMDVHDGIILRKCQKELGFNWSQLWWCNQYIYIHVLIWNNSWWIGGWWSVLRIKRARPLALGT